MTTHSDKTRDPLHQYTSSVGTLQDKLDRVLDNQRAVADSLSRVAAALRSISAAREQK